MPAFLLQHAMLGLPGFKQHAIPGFANELTRLRATIATRPVTRITTVFIGDLPEPDFQADRSIRPPNGEHTALLFCHVYCCENREGWG